MTTLSPWTPIFRRKLKYGDQFTPGSVVGEVFIPASVSADLVAVATEVLAPAVSSGPPTSNLRGWWDASDLSTVHESGGFVTQWDDKSGNSAHMIPSPSATSGPVTGVRTKNGLNVLDFQNASGTLGPPAQGLYQNSGTLRFSSNHRYIIFIVFVEDTNTSQLRYPAWFGAASGGDGLQLPASQTRVELQTDSGGLRIAAGASVALGTWRLATGVMMTGTNAMLLRDNGATSGTNTMAGGITNTALDFFLASRSAIQRLMDGAIAEVLFYRSTSPTPPLTNTERDAAESYLMNKWAI